MTLVSVAPGAKENVASPRRWPRAETASMRPARAGPSGAEHAGDELAVGADGGREPERFLARDVLCDSERAAVSKAFQTLGKRSRILRVVDPVGEPENAGAGRVGCGEGVLERGQRCGAIRREGTRFEGCQRGARFRGRFKF
ncbi:hypothetical protein [Hyphomicrobium nitrativorans]|uniref:hypothetical protein n=1 Tax=Hyphomicrobium nitrativorans TaxID=1427356 RepID=UPI001FCCB962|nr:hypothetical protein [Hyphomicrobium nitrativorans]